MIGALLALLAAPQGYEVTWSAPKVFVEGHPYSVHVEFKAQKDGAIPAWMLQPSGFKLDGKPLDEKKIAGDIEFGAGASLVLDLDLAESIEKSKAFGRRDFKIALEGSDAKPVDVRFFVPAPKGVDYLDEKKAPAAGLAKYFVLLETNRGSMVAEMWPDVAPKHVRNYLDLCASGFYDGTLFHRVGPGFMIQGGDPNTKDPKALASWGTGNGPRMLNAEFSAKKHGRGVLSMARGDPANSASCQFFVMHAAAPALDGKYSAFGQLLDGFDALDAIATAPGTPLDAQNATFRPREPQRIEHALVLVAP